MAGFLAGVAEGYKSARQRIEAREAREEELAYRRAKDKAQEERFKLTHGENVKQTEYAQKKYFLEKSKAFRNEQKKEQKRKEEKQEKIDLRRLKSIKEGYLHPVSKRVTTDTDPSGWADDLEDKTQHIIPTEIAETLLRLGVNPQQAITQYQDAVRKRRSEGTKQQEEIMSRKYPDVADTIKLMQEGKIDMLSADNPFWIRAGEINPVFNFKNVSTVNHKNKSVLIKQRDEKANNQGNITYVTTAYPRLTQLAIQSNNTRILDTSIQPILKDGKVYKRFSRDIFNKKPNDIDKDDTELMARFMTVMDGVLGSAKAEGPDKHQNLINTFNSSKHLKNDIMKSYMYFNNKRLSVGKEMTDGYIMGGSEILKNFKNLTTLVTPLLKDGKFTPDEEFKIEQESLQKSNNAGSLDPNKNSEQAIRDKMKATRANDIIFTDKGFPVFAPEIGPSQWGLTFAVFEQQGIVSDLSFNSPQNIKDAITRQRLSDWGSNLPPSVKATTEEDQRIIAQHLVNQANKQGWNNRQLNAVAVGLVTGNFIYHKGSANKPGDIRLPRNTFDADSEVYKKIQASKESTGRGIRSVNELMFLFKSNDEFEKNLEKHPEFQTNGVIFNTMTSLTSSFLADVVDIGVTEFNEIKSYLESDSKKNNEFVSNMISKGDVNFTVKNKIKLKKALNQYTKKAFDSINEAERRGVMNTKQLETYSQIQLQKVKLAYTLAGVFQGGSSGSRTISDQDFKIIMDALWSPNETRVKANLRELQHSLYYAQQESMIALRLGTVTGLHDQIRDATFTFGKVLRKEVQKQEFEPSANATVGKGKDNTFNSVVSHNVKFTWPPVDDNDKKEPPNTFFDFDEFRQIVNSGNQPLNINQMEDYFKYRISLAHTLVKTMDMFERDRKQIDKFQYDENWNKKNETLQNWIKDRSTENLSNFLNSLSPVFQRYHFDYNDKEGLEKLQSSIIFDYGEFKNIDEKLNSRINKMSTESERNEFRKKYNPYMKLLKSRLVLMYNHNLFKKQ